MRRPIFHADDAAGAWRARAARDACARLAADPRQPDAAGDPGDRRPADGPAGRDPARRRDAGAQPHLHLQPLPARAGHRVLADDGDRARAALQCGARRAADLPRRPVADRDRAAALLAAAVARRRAHARSSASPPELASQGQTFLRAYMWCTAPWLLFQLLRNFVSALERPRIVLWLSLGGIALNALLSWSLIFGHFGLPALGLVGGGLGSTLDLAGHVRRAGRRRDAPTGSSAASICSATGGASIGQRTTAMVRLGWPIGADHGARNGRVRARRLFHGLDRRPGGRRACGRAAARRADLHGPARARPGGDGARRPRARPPRRAGIARAGWTAWVIGVAFMGAMALVMWSIPRQLVTLFLDRRPGQCRDHRARRQLPAVAAAFQLVDGAQVIGAGMLRGLHDTRWPLIFALSAIGASASASAPGWPSPRLEGRRHLGRAGQRARRGRGADARPLDAARPPRPDPASRTHKRKPRASR